VDHDPCSAADRIRGDLERVLAVLECVARGNGRRGELPRPTSGDESAIGCDRDCGSEPEAAGLGAEDEVRLSVTRPFGELFYRLLERCCVEQE
jgi:hypothetical protein